MGSLVLNRLRLTVALVLLGGTLWLLRGSPWPLWASDGEIRLLAASGLVGFVVCDSLYFRALVILGAGRAALLLSLAPVFTALQARLFLGETLGPRAVAGIALVLGGLAGVLYRREPDAPAHAEGSPLVGVACGVAAAVFASAGYLLSKMGMRGDLDALSGTVVRVAAALPVAWALAPLQGGFRRHAAALRDRVALRTMLAGAVAGPFLGVSLSLYALQHAEAAVATSIFACAPLLALVLGARFHRERLTARIVLGALVAVSGVVLLFQRHA
jgi:uncharacterized membrane protein